MFKKGDKVKIVKVTPGQSYYETKKKYLGQTFTMEYPNFHSGQTYKHHLSMGSEFDWSDAELKKVKVKPLKFPYFVLQYEIDGDPIEEIQTLKLVKQRIEEPHKVRGHSFVVYEVTSKRVISIEQRIEIKGI